MVNHKPYFQAIQNYTHVVSGVVVAFFEVFTGFRKEKPVNKRAM